MLWISLLCPHWPWKLHFVASWCFLHKKWQNESGKMLQSHPYAWPIQLLLMKAFVFDCWWCSCHLWPCPCLIDGCGDPNWQDGHHKETNQFPHRWLILHYGMTHKCQNCVECASWHLHKQGSTNHSISLFFIFCILLSSHSILHECAKRWQLTMNWTSGDTPNFNLVS